MVMVERVAQVRFPIVKEANVSQGWLRVPHYAQLVLTVTVALMSTTNLNMKLDVTEGFCVRFGCWQVVPFGRGHLEIIPPGSQKGVPELRCTMPSIGDTNRTGLFHWLLGKVQASRS